MKHAVMILRIFWFSHCFGLNVRILLNSRKSEQLGATISGPGSAICQNPDDDSLRPTWNQIGLPIVRTNNDRNYAMGLVSIGAVIELHLVS